MTSDLIKLCASAIDMEWVKKHAFAINAMERTTANNDFAKSTEYIKHLMEEAGFSQVERYALPCDGVTTYDDCTMPLAWDRTGRSTLEMIAPEKKLLADSDVEPITSVIWSPPTPEGGVTAELIDLHSAVSDDWHEFAGKIVLWDSSPSSPVRKKLIESGALGIVAYVDATYDSEPDSVRWMNGSGHTGWYYTKDDPMIWVFSITPRHGRELAKRLAAGEKVILKAEMKTKVYPGEIYTLTGVIPGKTQKEHALVAHMYEPFVPDDAAGVVLSIAVGKALKNLAEAGRISALETGLRVTFAMERYGFSEYFFNRERTANIISMINMDSVCHQTLKKAGVLLELRHSPASAPCFGPVLLRNMLKENFPEVPFQETPGNLSDDTFSADSSVYIPCCWLHTPPAPDRHHNTGAIFNDADWDIAAMVAAVMTACHARLNNAAAGVGREDLVREITEGVLADAADDFARLAEGVFSADEKEIIATFLVQYHARRITLLNASVPGAVDEAEIIKAVERCRSNAPAMKENAPMIPFDHPMRKWIVTRVPGFSQLMSFAKVPVPERYTRIAMPVMLFMALLDGKRTVHESTIITNFFHKRTPQPDAGDSLLATLEFLEKYGYVTIKKNGL
ncbi:MAG: hypothetical protein IKD44_08055 [Lentisphaeria bacterium]|nr:hypothetical protein [Lentisphaeria bacterium]